MFSKWHVKFVYIDRVDLICMHANIFTYIHTYIHTLMYVYKPTCILQCIQHTCMHVHIHKYMSAYIHSLEFSISWIFVFPESGFPFSRICGIFILPEILKYRDSELWKLQKKDILQMLQSYKIMCFFRQWFVSCNYVALMYLNYAKVITLW